MRSRHRRTTSPPTGTSSLFATRCDRGRGEQHRAIAHLRYDAGMRWIAVALIAACGSSPPRLSVDDDFVRNASRDAIAAAANNIDRMEELLGGDIVDGGLWFSDAKCANEFSSPGAITPDKQRDFAACLVGLHLEASPRRDALGDVVVMTYAPGFEVEARVVPDRHGPATNRDATRPTACRRSRRPRSRHCARAAIATGRSILRSRRRSTSIRRPECTSRSAG
jgi:hypothetical protein